jgi:hypothetical protein
MALIRQQLQTILTDVLGQNGLNINRTYANPTNAINNIPQPIAA